MVMASSPLCRACRAPLLLLAVLAAASTPARAQVGARDRSRTPAETGTSGYVSIGGVPLYYRVVGSGPPLLLLHGGLSSSVDFNAIVPLLSPTRRLILVDRRGHGRSGDNAAPYSYAAMADDMKAMLDVLHVDRADVLGFSDGGTVAYHLASTYPAKVRRVVAVAANSRIDGVAPETIGWVRDVLTAGNAAQELPDAAAAYRASNPKPDHFAEFVAKSRAMWLRDPYIANDGLAKIYAPVLFVVGERDAVRLDHVLEMRALVKEGHLCVLPNATHFVLLEKPALVFPIVADFLGSGR